MNKPTEETFKDVLPFIAAAVVAAAYFLWVFHVGGMMKYCLPTVIPIVLIEGFVWIMSKWALRIGKKLADEKR